MNRNVIEINGIKIAIVHSDEVLFTDEQAALDFLATLRYETDCDRIALHKESIPEEFFILSTGFAGKILQKVVNYSFKFAIIGDFSQYTSKALRDFIYECNNGNDIFYVSTEEEALKKLSEAS